MPTPSEIIIFAFGNLAIVAVLPINILLVLVKLDERTTLFVNADSTKSPIVLIVLVLAILPDLRLIFPTSI